MTKLASIASIAILSTLASAGEVPDFIDVTRAQIAARRLTSYYRVLYVTAHPDDEDNALIAKLARGRGAYVALLTLTRGNGGQNEIGPELGDALGLLRARELEAAHHFDGAVQLFGEADDFGYSFSVDETLRAWGEETMLRRIVAAIRTIKPHVIITMSPEGTGGGQHHQTTGQLTQEATRIATDSSRWPELGAGHRVQGIYARAWRRAPDGAKLIRDTSITETDHVLDISYSELGRLARAQHKCQGMVRLAESFDLKYSGLFSLEPRLSEQHPEIEHVWGAVDAWRRTPSLGLGALLTNDCRRSESIRRYEEESVNRYLASGLEDAELRLEPLGLLVGRYLALNTEVSANRDRLALGDSAEIRCKVQSDGANCRVRLQLFDRFGEIESRLFDLASGERSEKKFVLEAESITAQSGRLSIDPLTPDLADRLKPRRTPFEVSVSVEFGSHWIEIARHAVECETVLPNYPILYDVPLEVVPDPSVRPERPRRVLIEEQGEIEVVWLVSSLEPGQVEVTPELELPGWRLEPPSRTVNCLASGVEVPAKFKLTYQDGAKRVRLRCTTRHLGSGRVSREGYRVIQYPHIRRICERLASRTEVTAFSCRIRPDLRLGYVAGTGDTIPLALEDLGYHVDFLDHEDLLESDLDRFDTIVVGVRAYKERADLKAGQKRLMRWVERGGHLIVQYHKLELNDSKRESPFAPYPGLAVRRKRVTSPHAPVKLTEPEHPIFREPNLIGASDWSGWIQERGLYFVDVKPESPYRDLVLLEDPWAYNAGLKGGSLVEARVGEGGWIYVGLALFRQLPAGVPGAYRLLANLLAR